MSINYRTTDDAVYAQVSLALMQYASMLRHTNHRDWWHRLKCQLGEPEASQLEVDLRQAEALARQVVNATPAHRAVLRMISNARPAAARQRDNFEALCKFDE